MKKSVIIELSIHDVEYEYKGTMKFAKKAFCHRIVFPSDLDISDGKGEIGMSENAKKNVMKFLKGPKKYGKRLFIAGTYEFKNGINCYHFKKALRHKHVGEEIFIYDVEEVMEANIQN
jgi:hypothetical protein